MTRRIACLVGTDMSPSSSCSLLAIPNIRKVTNEKEGAVTLSGDCHQHQNAFALLHYTNTAKILCVSVIMIKINEYLYFWF